MIPFRDSFTKCIRNRTKQIERTIPKNAYKQIARATATVLVLFVETYARCHKRRTQFIIPGLVYSRDTRRSVHNVQMEYSIFSHCVCRCV